MSNTRASQNDLLERIHRFVAAGERNELADDQWAEFEEFLWENDDACRLYVEYTGVSALLPTVMDALPDRESPVLDVSSFEQPPVAFPSAFNFPSNAIHGTVGYFSSSWPAAYLVATVILGVGFLIGTFVHVSQPPQIARPSVPLPSPLSPLPSTVGRITGMVACQWADAATEAFNGAHVPLGRKYALSSGLLEITYDAGAKVILQGPATYEVESAAGGYLSLGKLTAKVEKKGEGERKDREGSRSTEYGVQSTDHEVQSGDRTAADSNVLRTPYSVLPAGPSPLRLPPSALFSVRTPTATVTDLGTEFGVEVDDQGATETQVFQGIVELARTGADGKPDFAQRLREGDAVHIGPQESLPRAITGSSRRFVRTMPRDNAILHDKFDVPRDYLSAGTAGTIWSGLLNAQTATRLESRIAEAGFGTPPGRLHMAVGEDAWAGWSDPNRERIWKNAPCLYLDVSDGDFDARVKVTSQATGDFSVAGLMARRDDDNFVSVNSDAWSPHEHRFATRNETANVDANWQDQEPSVGDYALRLVRVGDIFLASGSVDGGQTWKPLPWGNGLTGLRRPDMTGPLQVGLWYGTFNPMPGEATFENFTIDKRARSREKGKGGSIQRTP